MARLNTVPKERREKMWKILVALSCVFSIAAAECFKETADSEQISIISTRF